MCHEGQRQPLAKQGAGTESPCPQAARRAADRVCRKPTGAPRLGGRQACRSHRAHRGQGGWCLACGLWLRRHAGQPLAVAVQEPAPDRRGGELRLLGDGRHPLAVVDPPHHPGPSDAVDGSRPHGTSSSRHGAPPMAEAPDGRNHFANEPLRNYLDHE
jgi:hypothetical protein